MIKEFLLYFFIVFGLFSFVEMISRLFLDKLYSEYTYIVTYYKNKKDKKKIIFLARTLNFKIYVINLTDTENNDITFIKDRYFHIEFVTEEQWKKISLP